MPTTSHSSSGSDLPVSPFSDSTPELYDEDDAESGEEEEEEGEEEEEDGEEEDVFAEVKVEEEEEEDQGDDAKDETANEDQLGKEAPRETSKDAKEAHSSQVCLSLGDSMVDENTRSDHEKEIVVENKDVKCDDFVEKAPPHLHTTWEDFSLSRGRCSMGNSCLFRHQKEASLSSNPRRNEDLAGTSGNANVHDGKGSREDAERCKHSASRELLDSSNTESPSGEDEDMVLMYHYTPLPEDLSLLGPCVLPEVLSLLDSEGANRTGSEREGPGGTGDPTEEEDSQPCKATGAPKERVFESGESPPPVSRGGSTRLLGVCPGVKRPLTQILATLDQARDQIVTLFNDTYCGMGDLLERKDWKVMDKVAGDAQVQWGAVAVSAPTQAAEVCQWAEAEAGTLHRDLSEARHCISRAETVWKEATKCRAAELAQHAQELETEKARHTQEMEKEKARHAQELEAEKARHAREMEVEKARHAQELEVAQAQHAEELLAERSRSAHAKTALRDRFQNQMVEVVLKAQQDTLHDIAARKRQATSQDSADSQVLAAIKKARRAGP